MKVFGSCFPPEMALPPWVLLFWDCFVKASTDAVFRYFYDSENSGIPSGRLGNAMRILGMYPAEYKDLWQQLQLCRLCFLFLLMPCFCWTQVKMHLEDLGCPDYIDHKMFHHFIED